MAKGKSKGTSRAQKPQQPVKAGKASGELDVSDALRQAVKDLGGDDDDLDLIAGVDSDDESPADNASKIDEVRSFTRHGTDRHRSHSKLI